MDRTVSISNLNPITVGPDFLKVLTEFHENGIINKGLKNSSITLVLKREGPSELSHYRSINLIGRVYKLLAKVPANRLKEVLPEIIGESQRAFVEDRQILDSVIIANELVNMRYKDKKTGLKDLLFKIDMEKAYEL